ncbi:hypothetical protein [Shimia sp. FJ5]|uniref:hypothetical protein n=1 Tax=Shimia sp. FJ5 TaxID=3079054 RepID=UPI00293DF246|nr:hypothetical protein [Shimia sp. FJ5]MDV4146454.1 hypothetical protein [Shimia sp. FJ5]
MRLFWKTLAVFLASAAAVWSAAGLLGREFDLPTKALLALWLVILFLGALARALRDGNRSRRAVRNGATYEEAFGLEASMSALALKILGLFAILAVFMIALGAAAIYTGNLELIGLAGEAITSSVIAAAILHFARYGVAGQGDTSLSDIETDTRPVGNPFYGYTTYERNYPFSSH